VSGRIRSSAETGSEESMAPLETAKSCHSFLLRPTLEPTSYCCCPHYTGSHPQQCTAPAAILIASNQVTSPNGSLHEESNVEANDDDDAADDASLWGTTPVEEVANDIPMEKTDVSREAVVPEAAVTVDVGC
jgi:hypothetical protein